MATLEQRELKLEQANEGLQALVKTNAQSLARTDELSRDINFSGAVLHFETMLDVIRQLAERDISRLPTQLLDGIIGACKVLTGLIEKVNGFILNQDNPGDVCGSIIQEVKNAYDNVVNPLIPPLAFTATQATDYAQIEREAKGYHATMKEERDSLIKYIEKVKKDAESALSAVKELAAEGGVSSNAEIFIRNADEQGAQAAKWFNGTIWLSGITLVVAIVFLVIGFKYKPADTAAAVQYIVSKIIVLSTLSFGIFWCARNYRAHKHNQTLNQHRANALQTFRAFVEGTLDDRVKDAVLLHAAQAAFTPRPTGYDSPDKEMQTINPVVEILGNTLKKP